MSQNKINPIVHCSSGHLWPNCLYLLLPIITVIMHLSGGHAKLTLQLKSGGGESHMPASQPGAQKS